MRALVGILGAQVWAASAIFEAIGLPGTAGAVLATLVFIVYTAFSGLWAAALTVRGIVELLIYSYDVYTSGVFIPLVVFRNFYIPCGVVFNDVAVSGMWGSKPEWGLDGRCGAYSSESHPMKTGGWKVARYFA